MNQIPNNQDSNTIKSNDSSNISSSEDKESNNITKKSFYKYNAKILSDYKKDTEYDLNFKVIVIGNSGVGKTCITNQAVRQKFTDNYQSTIGMEIYSLYVQLDDKAILKLQIWDTCGQEVYRSLITNFYRSSSLAIIVYSIDKKESFKDLGEWIKELRANNSPDTKVILVGNKLDLAENREVSYEEGKKFMDDYGFIDFFETSAKTGENIENMFLKAAIILYEEHINYKDIESTTSYNTFKPSEIKIIKKSKNKGRKKRSCC